MFNFLRILFMSESIILTNVTVDDLKSIIDERLQAALTTFKPAEPETKEEELIKIEEVCKLLNVSKVTIHAWKKSGKLPFYRISNKIYFKRNEIVDALRKIERKGWN